MLFADPQVIQIEWQACAAFGGAVGAALVAAAKIIAGQLKANSDAAAAQAKATAEAVAHRHAENREDAIEAREENRNLSGAILNIQSQTVKTLGEMQTEIRGVLTRLGQCEQPGSKTHVAHPH